MKKYILTYTFLNVDCEMEFTTLFDFLKKADWCMEQPEILQDSICFRTESK